MNIWVLLLIIIFVYIVMTLGTYTVLYAFKQDEILDAIMMRLFSFLWFMYWPCLLIYTVFKKSLEKIEELIDKRRNNND